MMDPLALIKPEIAERYRGSLQLMRQEFPENVLRDVAVTLITICEEARNYEWPERKMREGDRSALDGAAKAQTSARTLERYLKSQAAQTNILLVAAANDLGLRIVERDGSTAASQAEAMSKLLERFADLMKAHGPFARAGAMLHRVRVGPLIYPQPIECQADMPKPETCLAIVLSTRCRKHSIAGTMRFQMGEPIPAGGRPRWALVAALVSEALGVNVSYGNVQTSVSKVVRRHPDLRIGQYN